MNEPCKMFSVVLPFNVYEQLKAVARVGETSVGGLLREGADLLLKGKTLEANKYEQDRNS